ncbi:MAG: DUF3256 family protein [Bacteroidaceae bacterium]|nr:DUF3256 family protein [Bacteroidaceae bacterium]
MCFIIHNSQFIIHNLFPLKGVRGASFTFLFLFSFFIFHFSFSPARAQVLIRDIYAEAPDSIFPLLTKNNRLDQIDFRENNMQAVVKNLYDERVELLVLTDRYLQLQLSERCVVEMRLLSDSTFCMVQTYNAPAPDSRVRFFDTAWHELPLTIERPSVDDFLSDDIDEDVRLALQALPLIKASLSENDNSITWELQTSELTSEQRKKAEGKVRTLSFPTIKGTY